MDTVPTKCCIVAPRHVAPELADSTTEQLTLLRLGVRAHPLPFGRNLEC